MSKREEVNFLSVFESPGNRMWDLGSCQVLQGLGWGLTLNFQICISFSHCFQSFGVFFQSDELITSCQQTPTNSGALISWYNMPLGGATWGFSSCRILLWASFAHWLWGTRPKRLIHIGDVREVNWNDRNLSVCSLETLCHLKCHTSKPELPVQKPVSNANRSSQTQPFHPHRQDTPSLDC